MKPWRHGRNAFNLAYATPTIECMHLISHTQVIIAIIDQAEVSSKVSRVLMKSTFKFYVRWYVTSSAAKVAVVSLCSMTQ